MICKCGTKTAVVDSRYTEGGLRVRRRRECPKCHVRFTTSEGLVADNGLSVEPSFDFKVLSGLPDGRTTVMVFVPKSLMDEFQKELKGKRRADQERERKERDEKTRKAEVFRALASLKRERKPREEPLPVVEKGARLAQR